MGIQLGFFPVPGSLPGERSKASPACPCPHKPALALAAVDEDLVEGIRNTAALYYHPSRHLGENRARRSQNKGRKMPSGAVHLAHPVPPHVAIICQRTGGPAGAQPVPVRRELQLVSLLPALSTAWRLPDINNSRPVKRISPPLPPFPGL